ncbi:unnamed protein product [Rotaria sp. Silwood2]|nr:unnamed protein product [Rotaria sp. Silwood2]CAF4644870.1 unnamed protein product [Rotaria sp. Silwood2]
MSSITVFNDLPDLVLLELFSYLSSTDILWGWAFLNNLLTSLITELGFFCHVNLSSAHRHQFDTILRRIPLNKIESLIIDIDASPLQLSRWPHLPRLITLKLKGTGRSLDFEYPMYKFSTLVTDVLLRQLPVLRLLDLGTNALVYSLRNWHVTSVSISLTYLRISLDSLNDVLRILSTRSLSDTLEQLHLSVEAQASYPSLDSLTPLCMMHLHTFTFATPLCSHYHNEKWSFVEEITSSTIMPVLRWINLAMILSIDHLIHLNQMSLFVDDRHVDVHFAFSVNDRAKHAQLSEYIPHDARFHKRQVVGVTFINNVQFENLEIVPIDLAYVS